jgi:DNA topoisomerase III
MKTLIIAEKPSVANDIANALSGQYGRFAKHADYYEADTIVVTSAVGHLLTIQAPEEFEVKKGKWNLRNLPVLPAYFDCVPIDKTKQRLSAVVDLMRRKDVGTIVNACDAGREGELIFRLILQYAEKKKPLNKTIKRLWLQSMTQGAIIESFKHLRSEEQMQGLAMAARSRAEADWLVGINGTRAVTAFNSQDGGFSLTTVGRVQTPTLSLVVEREETIKNFEEREYWEVSAVFEVAAGSYAAKWFDEDYKKDSTDNARRPERIWSKEKAEAIAARTLGCSADVSDKTKPLSQAAPSLFDLTTLQRVANQRFGFSAKTTLSIAQSLYEKHKATTYPRTDSKCLPQDYIPTCYQVLESLQRRFSDNSALAKGVRVTIDSQMVVPNKRIFNDAKISDHFAIIPTSQTPSGLSDAEEKLYNLIVKRFVAVFFPSAEYLVTTRTTVIHNPEHDSFRASGKILVTPGWLSVYGKDAYSEDDSLREDEGGHLPQVSEGEVATAFSTRAEELHTVPPAHYNEASLLSAMESAGKNISDTELRDAIKEKGLGTPATRASIIEGLIDEKYISRDGKEITITPKASQLIILLKGLGIAELTDPRLTAEWEHQLSLIEHDPSLRAPFIEGIGQTMKELVHKARTTDSSGIAGDFADLSEPCPLCQSVVREHFKNYHCSGCYLNFPKQVAGRIVEISEANELLRNKQTQLLSGFKSKAGWPFKAQLVLKPGESGKLEMGFNFENSRIESSSTPFDISSATEVAKCPKCSSSVYDNGTSYICAKCIEGRKCDFRFPKTLLSQPIDAAQLNKMLQSGESDELDGFVSKTTNKPFKAKLVWDKKHQKMNFGFSSDGESKPFKRKGQRSKRRRK